MMTTYKNLGIKQAFVDAKEKVTGRAQYLDDMEFPGLLIGKILRSPHPHARIVKIDTSAAEALEGVHAVLTAKEAPKNRFGMEIADCDIFAIDKVKYVGEETFRLCQTYVDEMVLVDTDAICAAIKDVFEDTRAVLEPAGALAIAGAKAYAEKHRLKDKTLVAIACGA